MNDNNRGTFGRVADPDAPWGRDTDGTPFTKAEYDHRFTNAKTDPETGRHYDNYPPNDGAVPGTRRDYHDLRSFVREYGGALDRIGEEDGKYLGLMKDGIPASFEQRSLPVNSLEKPYFSYRLADAWPPGTKGWTVEISDVARAFGRDGGAQQILIRDKEGNEVPVEELLKRGILVHGGGSK
ncbi:TNT domain-containing protein [Leifsonia xyli]|uniref:TNT domain-containing protein n=1 Tax=Leifsonia xyli TaxID=1575 RepID=UPI003D67DA60